MKKKYTRKQILESIKYWKNKLNEDISFKTYNKDPKNVINQHIDDATYYFWTGGVLIDSVDADIDVNATEDYVRKICSEVSNSIIVENIGENDVEDGVQFLLFGDNLADLVIAGTAIQSNYTVQQLKSMPATKLFSYNVSFDPFVGMTTTSRFF